MVLILQMLDGLNLLRGLKASVNLSLKNLWQKIFSTKKKCLLKPLTDYKINRFFKPIFAHPRRCILSGLHNSVLHIDLSGLHHDAGSIKTGPRIPGTSSRPLLPR